MVYPTTRCWDTQGSIDGQNYKTKDGAMAKAIKAMIDRLTSGSSDGGDSNGDGGTVDDNDEGTGTACDALLA